ncbi:hypothetical protein CANCADRAFT_43772 [Tortispora caseinolytica NRRL Y-17796]|uniref:Replication factor C subunit 1 n=1 Tax=Tortispora caseinolytica NRRL Y-17796 TaxID=767744 RepID=A0A1E4TEA6_9ASCO|nr:hypothetical protein CANCADRAFT_43772 [Tortispora caseinolytica NRRL Y-17796]
MSDISRFFQKQPQNAVDPQSHMDSEDDVIMTEASSRPMKKQPASVVQPIIVDVDLSSDNSANTGTNHHNSVSESVVETSPSTPVKRKDYAASTPVSNVKRQKVAADTTASDIDANSIIEEIPSIDLKQISTIDFSETKGNFYAMKAKKESANADSAPAPLIELPDAAPGCLTGLSFLFTGEMNGLDRTTAQEAVKKYGGRVVSAPSGKVSVVVIGENAGPSKIQKIKKLKLKCIDVHGFVDLLKKMPAGGGSGAEAQKAREKQQRELDDAMRSAQEDQRREEQARAKQTADLTTGTAAGKGKNVIASSSLNDPASMLWTSKYAPKSLNDICGNKKAVQTLKEWLESFREKARNGFADGTPRAVLISGPPGIGKTTAAHLVCELAGYDYVETNASDFRSKKLLSNELLGVGNGRSMRGFLSGSHDSAEKMANRQNLVLIMDEVDGMSSGDTGGVGEMAKFCRTTNIPVILICNDKSLPKMRPFDKVTLDLPFRRPTADMIRSRIMSIAFRQGVKLNANIINSLVEFTHSDIRQIINLISTFSLTKKTPNADDAKELTAMSEKNTILKPFDIAAKLFSPGLHSSSSTASFLDKTELYFNDHDFTPLMIQENYLSMKPTLAMDGTMSEMDAITKAAEFISDGELVDTKIHGPQQQWSLLPLHGALSSVAPAEYAAGRSTDRYRFTSYLGQNSKRGKYSRLLQEVRLHMRLRTAMDKDELRMQVLPQLSRSLTIPLIKEGTGGVRKVISLLDEYYLSKDDWTSIVELGVGHQAESKVLSKIDSATKRNFTAIYNNENHAIPFSTGNVNKVTESKKKVVADFEEALDDIVDDEAENDEEQEKEETVEDISKLKGVKVKKPRAPAKKKKKAN